jgi:hypothetical protein
VARDPLCPLGPLADVCQEPRLVLAHPAIGPRAGGDPGLSRRPLAEDGRAGRL